MNDEPHPIDSVMDWKELANEYRREFAELKAATATDATELARLRRELLKWQLAAQRWDEARAELISDYEDEPTWKEVAEMWKKEAATMSKAADKWLAERDEALAALAAAQVDSATWQPIETAPRDGTFILAYWDDDDPQTEAVHFKDGNWLSRNTDPIDGCWITPTHWQPLPAPPAMKPTP